MNRRNWLQLAGLGMGNTLLPSNPIVSLPRNEHKPPFIYCLNMATIRGHKLGFASELEVASKAGFRSVEIWMDSLQGFLDAGGTLAQARRLLSDLGLNVENAIGFSEWIIDDTSRRQKAVDQLKREMEQLAAIGCKRTAAPPMGATQLPLLSLKSVAERYRSILELGEKVGVIPQVELWGFSQNLGTLSEVMYVAVESGHASAKVLLDVFHLYKGQSSLDTLPLIHPRTVDILHMNDYLTTIPPASITDSDRIFPGEGTAPIHRILQALRSPERPLILSVEVFNKTYYAQEAGNVAAAALEHLKSVTAGL